MMSSSSAANEPVKDDESVECGSPFQLGENVLAFHGPCLYDAKVQKVEFHKERGWRYYIHYHGWNKSWDEWLDIDHLLKQNEENVRKQKELKEKHEVEKNAKPGRLSRDKTKSTVGTRGRKRNCEILEKEEDIVPSEGIVSIQIPSTLKTKLVDDNKCITQLGQLVKLPCSPNVNEILNKYLDYRVKKDGMIVDALAELVKGLCCYFDKALPAMLLYKQERQQYEEVIFGNISPSGVYGAEHLLRLFVKLPEMLSWMNIEMKTLAELQQALLDFLRFLQSNESEFFHSGYEKPEELDLRAVKGEDN